MPDATPRALGETSATLPPVTRRDLLEAGLAGAAMTLVPGGLAGAQPAAPPKLDGYIDAHVHVWTPDVERYPLAKGRKPAEMKPASFTPEQLMAHARPLGVSRVVLIQMSFYGFDNSYMLDTIARFPGVYSGVAVVDEEANPADEMRRLKKLGVRGFRLRPGDRPRDTWLTGAGMQAMWRCGAEEGLAMCPLINPDSLASVDKACAQFPDTTVVIDHFARVGVEGQIREADLAALCALARHKRTHVKVSAFYALGKKAPPYTDLGPMIQRLLDAFGRERLMWATDCPFQVDPGHTYADSLALIRERLEFLTAADREWILRKTAEKVFFA